MARARDPVRLTVVTNFYNEENDLPDYLDSLIAQSYQGFQALFIDDGSTDRSLEVIERYRDRLDLEVIKLPHVGLKKARAEGVGRVETELCAIFDADEILEPQCIERFVRMFDAPDVMAVGGYKVSWGDKWAVRGSRVVMEASLDAMQHPDGTAEHLVGGCFAFRTDVVQRLGGLEAYGVAEDADLAWKLRQHGYRVVLVKDIVVQHKDPQSLFGIFHGGYKNGILGFYTNRRYKRRFFRWHQLVKFGPLMLLALAPIRWWLSALGLIGSLASFLYYVRRIQRPLSDKLGGWIVFMTKSFGWSLGFVATLVSVLWHGDKKEGM